MAKYENLISNIDHDLVFNMRSKNDVGQSYESSRLIIPKKENRLPKPMYVKKISTHKNQTHTIHKISWSKVEASSYYVVFWCHSISIPKCDVRCLQFYICKV